MIAETNSEMVSLSRFLKRYRKKRIEKYLPTMDQLFSSQLIYSNYIASKPSRFMAFISYATFINLISVVIKCWILYFLPPFSPINFYLGDPGFILGSARKTMTILLSIWCLGSVIQHLHFILNSGDRGDHNWLLIGQVLATNRYKKIGVDPNIVKSFYRQVQLNCYLVTLAFLLFANVPSALLAPPQFRLPMMINAITHSWGCFAIVSYSVNFVLIYGLFVHVWLDYLELLNDRLIKIMTMEVKKKSNEPDLLDHCATTIQLNEQKLKILLIHMTDHYQELIACDKFYKIKHTLIFSYGFIAQGMVIFLLFFNQFSIMYKIALFICGIFNSIFFQYLQFFIGIHGQSKVINIDFCKLSILQIYLTPKIKIDKQSVTESSQSTLHFCFT